MKNPRVRVKDVQIRLETTIRGCVFVTSWYGPNDYKWRACMKSADRPIDILEENSLTTDATMLFVEIIEKMRRILEEQP